MRRLSARDEEVLQPHLGESRQEFLDVVRSAEWVSEEEDKQAVGMAAPADAD